MGEWLTTSDILTIIGMFTALWVWYNKTIQQVKDGVDAADKRLTDKLEAARKELHERITRGAADCRVNEKALQDQIHHIELQMVSESKFDAKMDRLEGNVNARIDGLKTEILSDMQRMLKAFKDS